MADLDDIRDGKNYGAHPNARDRFMLAVAKYGLGGGKSDEVAVEIR